MSLKFNKSFYKDFSFYVNLFITALWVNGVLNPINSLDFIASACFLVFSLYLLMTSLFKDNKK